MTTKNPTHGTTDEIENNPEHARKLFKTLNQIHIVCIHPNGLSITGKDFHTNVEEALKYCSAKSNAGYNIYWTVNQVCKGLDKKPSKHDIINARFLHVDIDPPKNGAPFDKQEVSDFLMDTECPPSFIVDSGAGIQAFWRLDIPQQNLESIEYVNRQISEYYQADHCHNIDRLMRVAGFRNIPDKTKRKRGRVDCATGWMVEDTGETYEAQEVTLLFPEATNQAGTTSNRIDVELSDKIKLLTLDDLKNPPQFVIDAVKNPEGKDRSADGLRAVRAMANAGYADEKIAGIALNEKNPVSAYYLKGTEREALRWIKRDLAKVREDSPYIGMSKCEIDWDAFASEVQETTENFVSLIVMPEGWRDALPDGFDKLFHQMSQAHDDGELTADGFNKIRAIASAPLLAEKAFQRLDKDDPKSIAFATAQLADDFDTVGLGLPNLEPLIAEAKSIFEDRELIAENIREGIKMFNEHMNKKGNASANQQKTKTANNDKANETFPNQDIKATPFDWPEPTSIEPRDWIFGRWILRGEVTTIIATGGIGKSGLLVSCALSMVSEQEILNQSIFGGPKNIWYWNLEDDHVELQRQFTASSLFHKIDPTKLIGSLYTDSGLEQGLCTANEGEEGFQILDPVYDAILEQIKSRNIDVLIIDPFVSSHEISENDNAKMDKVVKRWKKVATDGGCAIVLAHHSRKASGGAKGQETTTEDSRGASAVRDAARIAMALNRMSESEANNLGVKDGRERRSIFRIDMGKSSRAPLENSVWYQFHSQQLGNSRSDIFGDNVGVVAPWSEPDPFEDVTVEHLRTVQKKVAEGNYRDDSRSPDWIGYLIAEVTNLNGEEDKQRIKSIYRKWKNNGKFKVEKRPDKSRQLRNFVAVGSPCL